MLLARVPARTLVPDCRSTGAAAAETMSATGPFRDPALLAKGAGNGPVAGFARLSRGTSARQRNHDGYRLR